MNKKIAILGGLCVTAVGCVAAAIKSHKPTLSKKQTLEVFDAIYKAVRKTLPLTLTIPKSDTMFVISTDNGTITTEVSVTGIRCTTFDGSFKEFNPQTDATRAKEYIIEQYEKLLDFKTDREIITDMAVHNLNDVYSYFGSHGYGVKRFGVSLIVRSADKTAIIFRDCAEYDTYNVFRTDGTTPSAQLHISAPPSAIIAALEKCLNA